MDKVKLKAKKKRRAEKSRAEVLEYKKLADEFNDIYKSKGLKHNFKPAEFRKAYNSIRKEITCESIVACTIITLYAMRKLYRFGRVRLFRLATDITMRISDVGNKDRSIIQFSEELKDLAGLNVREYWNGFEPKPSETLTTSERQKIHAMFLDIPHILAIQMYAVYYSLNFKRKRMNRLCKLTSELLQFALCNNKLQQYIDELGKCGFMINMNGRFGAMGASENDMIRLSKHLGRNIQQIGVKR